MAGERRSAAYLAKVLHVQNLHALIFAQSCQNHLQLKAGRIGKMVLQFEHTTTR